MYFFERPEYFLAIASWLRLSAQIFISVCVLLAGSLTAYAQPAKPVATASAVAPVIASGPRWTDLTIPQQTILMPLAPTWEALEPSRKRKWISVAQSYPRLAPAEQQKMQSRMAEWAALSPRERAVARLNFAETKKVPPSDRTANWDAYQALSVEDRKKLAAKASPAPSGAAIAPKQSTPDKVIPVPVTRHTAPTSGSNGSPLSRPIDKKTLLPQAPKPAKATSAPSN